MTSTILKSYRFRAYPTPSQEKRLIAWGAALRSLWNLALEQRKMGYARPCGERRFPTAFDQINELTELRADLPWLADVPRHVCAETLIELDKAWQRCFSRVTRSPGWRRRSGPLPSCCESQFGVWRFDGSNIRFPKLGTVSVRRHRDVGGKPKTCTIKRDGDQWFISIVCEVVREQPTPRTGPVVGIDRGITNLLADSDGNLTMNPRFATRSRKRLARAQRAVSRKKKGSKNREKAKVRVMRIYRKVRRQREQFLHTQSARYAKSHGVVVIEVLNTAALGRGRLAGSIADSGWGKFAQYLGYKLAWSGGTLVEVPAHYSSQTCSACGVVDAASRKAERFNCTACGHSDHADLNAAKVLKTRASRSGLPMEGLVLEASLRSGKAKVKLRVVRNKTKQSARPGHGLQHWTSACNEPVEEK